MGGNIKTVLVGCGGISGAWLGPAKEIPELTMAGYVDIDEKAAKAKAAEWGPAGAPAGTDLGAMLRDVKPDVVFNCTTPEAHAASAIQALEAGCHVFVEKPLADSMENARAMNAAAKKAGKILAVMQNRRYQRNIRRLKRFLDSGALGRIGTVHSDFRIGAHFGGFRDKMRHVLLLDMAIHTFDAARFLMGQDPGSVVCREWNPPGSWYAHDASAAAVFEMRKGCVYTYRGSWCAEGLNTTWECDWHIIGEKGGVYWDGADKFAAQAVGEPGGFISKFKDLEVPALRGDEKDGGHGGAIREFVRCVLDGAVPETVSTDNIKSLAMVLGAIESSEKLEQTAIPWR